MNRFVARDHLPRQPLPQLPQEFLHIHPHELRAVRFQFGGPVAVEDSRALEIAGSRVVTGHSAWEEAFLDLGGLET